MDRAARSTIDYSIGINCFQEQNIAIYNQSIVKENWKEVLKKYKNHDFVSILNGKVLHV